MSELVFDLRLKRPDLPLEFRGRIPLEGVTALMGPSGSGKTSLLMMLAGLEQRARGEVWFGDTPWARRFRRVKPEARRIGMVFQDGRLFPHMTVADNIAYGAERRNVPPTAVHGIADALGLRPLLHRRPPTLSGGEIRRVAMARALASDPRILFLDEPLSGLDTRAREQVLPYLARAVSASGVPVIYVTHSRTEVTQFADRVLEVEDGRISGWGRAPARLDVVVEEVRGDRVVVRLGREALTLPGQGTPGDARRIGIPDNGMLLSRDPPGPSGAIAVMPVEVVRTVPRPAGLVAILDVAGQEFPWHIPAGTALLSSPVEAGQRLWVSILAAHLR